MESQNELISQAAPVDSATTTEAPQTITEQNVESVATQEPTAEQTTEEVQVAEPSKAVKELISQRKRRQQAEKEAEYWRGVAEAKGFKPETNIPQQQQSSIPQQPVQPVLDQFETFEEYEKAKDEYLVQQAEYRIAQKFMQYQQQNQQQKLQATFQQRIEAEAVNDPTIYDIVQDPSLPISDSMAPLVQESDVAPQLLKWLHNNRKEAARIAQMHPLMAAKEIGAIEAGIKNTPKPEPPKRVSQAPEPIKTVTPSGSVKEFDPETATMEEYYQHRMSQLRPRR